MTSPTASPHPRPARVLGDLLPDIEGVSAVYGDVGVTVQGVSHDTRRLRPGEVFVAVPGFQRDGLEFVPRALEQGAAAVVAESAPRDYDADRTPLVLVRSARAALADLAAAYHAHPSRALTVVGVTGTDGKTTTTQLLSAILESRGLSTGWLSTVNVRIGPRVDPRPADHTTPEAPDVQATLAEMRDAGVDVGIVETSSHALALDRVRGVAYRVGIFTNLSPEHLNFHSTFEAYREAKARLFERLPPEGLAVLNADDPNAAHMAAATRARVVRYGLDSPAADLTAHDIRLDPDGTRFTVRWQGLERRVVSSLVGRFNVSNWLAAFGAATAFGAGLEHLERAAGRQAPVAGRMNLVRHGQPFTVLVDFAHTPQALERVLATVRGLVQGRVLLLFGLAGGRDESNRPIMGALAARSTDFFLVTTDDAYDEDPAQIAAQIEQGARSAGAVEGERFARELDRRSAVRRLLAMAQPGDAVVLAGHGHEQELKIGGRAIPWNDARVAAEELEAMGYRLP